MAKLPAGFKLGWAGDHAIWRSARKTYDCQGNGARPSEHAPTCTLSIIPGDNYIEYVGETPAFQRGSAICVRCALHFKYIERVEAGALRWFDGKHVWFPLCQCQRPVHGVNGRCLTCGMALLAPNESPSMRAPSEK